MPVQSHTYPSFTSAPSEAWQDSLLLAKVLSGLLTAAIQAEAGVEKDGILKEVQQAGDFFLVELQEVEDRFHSLSELTEVEQKLKSIATASSGTLQQTLTQALDVTQFTELRLKNLQVETIPVESLNWEFTYKTSILNTSTLAALHHTEPDCFVSSQIVIPESTIDLPVERLVPLLQSQFPSWKMVNARKYVAGKSIADEKQRLFEEGVVAVFQDLSVMDTILISAFEEALGLPKGYVNRPVNFYRLFGTTKEEQGVIGANAFDLPSIWEALETRQRHTASISGAAPTGDLRFANGDALVGLVLVKRASDVDTNFTMAYAVQFVTEDAVKIKVQLKV